MHGGKIALSGTISEIKDRHRYNGFVLEFDSIKTASLFENIEELNHPSINMSRSGNTVTVFLTGQDTDGHFLLDVLSKKRIVPLKFAALEPTLESLFMEVVQ